MVFFFGLALAADPAAGRAVFEANCTACHGLAGDGKGPAALALKVKPADFTQAVWWSTRTDTDVAASIRAGKPGTPMVAFSSLTDVQVADLVAYLRSLSKAP